MWPESRWPLFFLWPSGPVPGAAQALFRLFNGVSAVFIRSTVDHGEKLHLSFLSPLSSVSILSFLNTAGWQPVCHLSILLIHIGMIRPETRGWGKNSCQSGQVRATIFCFLQSAPTQRAEPVPADAAYCGVLRFMFHGLPCWRDGSAGHSLHNVLNVFCSTLRCFFSLAFLAIRPIS
jgi:hypothetical protein